MKSVLCKLCNVVTHKPHQLKLHVTTTLHKEKERHMRQKIEELEAEVESRQY